MDVNCNLTGVQKLWNFEFVSKVPLIERNDLEKSIVRLVTSLNAKDRGPHCFLSHLLQYWAHWTIVYDSRK